MKHLLYLMMTIVISMISISACSNYKKPVHSVKGMNAIYYTLMPSSALTNDKFDFNGAKLEYFSGRKNDGSCDGKKLGIDNSKADTPQQLQDGEIYLPKNYGWDYRSVAEDAYSDHFVSATELYRIACARVTFYGTQNNIKYVSNTEDFPLVCGGECPDHCGCLPYGKVEYKKFYFKPIRA